MSRRNTRQGKAGRRAERERRRRSTPSGQEPQDVDVQAVRVAPGLAGSGSRNSDERGFELRSDADGGLSAVEPGEADLEANADPGDFGGLDADDADLQATLTVLAVLADDISDATEVADDLTGDADGLEVPDGPEDLGSPEAGLPSAEASGEDEEILAFSEDDDDLPAARVSVAGATADPVKDYLKQIGKVPLLNAEQEVDLAKRIEAGLFAEEKLAEAGGNLSPDARTDLEWVAEDGRRAKDHLLEANLRLVVAWPSATPGAGCCSWT